MKSILRYSLYCLVLAGFCFSPRAQTSGIIEERVFFFALIEGRAYRLEASVYRPDDNERHPLALMSHGYPGSAGLTNPALVTRLSNLGRELASEGIAAVLFTRRGYGNSEGPNTEIKATAVETGLEVAKDYRGALDYWKGVSFVDPDKMVLIGVSHSGWGMLAAATVMMDSGVRGVVNISGGSAYGASWPPPSPQLKWDHWVAGAAEMGKDALLPSFWIYSENDLGNPGHNSRRMFEAYNEAGGMGFLLMLLPYGSNGHAIGNVPSLYLPQLNDYLATIGIRDEPLAAPSIVWRLGNIVYDPGDTGVFNMQFTANPLPTIQWRKDGVDLQNSSGKIAGATSSTLSIFDVQLADTGDYTFVLTNSEGSVISGPMPVSLNSTPAPTPTPTPTAPSRGSGGGGGGGAPSTWFISVLALVAIVRWIALRSRTGSTLF